MARILVVDDDDAFREGMAETLGRVLGHEVHEARDGDSAIRLVQRSPVDVIFLDLRMPGTDGLAVLGHLCGRRGTCSVPVVMLTGYADADSTIEAMKRGAFDHLTKPVGRGDLERVLAQALQRPRPSPASGSSPPGTALIGASAPMREIHKLIGVAAASDVTVLVTGETGTGKECVANALHRHSARTAGPFVAVNCAAVPAELLESELFGHVRGAFTGALTDRLGRFREAHGGTLFLDEVGDMPLPMQAKLLRVLQDRQVKAIGGSSVSVVDIRIIAATSCNLPEAVRAGRFRQDLFYRLHVMHIHLPPLRERLADLALLAEHFLQRSGVGASKQLSSSAMKVLLDHDWPGNVRELENLMQRLSVVVRGPVIDGRDVAEICRVRRADAGLDVEDLLRGGYHAAVARVEQMLIRHALVTASHNRAEAARRLGINRQLLYQKIKEYDISG